MDNDVQFVQCPYYFCNAAIKVIPVGPSNGENLGSLMQLHEIKNNLLKGNCVASLLRYPVSEITQQVFNNRLKHDAETISLARAEQHMVPLGTHEIKRVAPDDFWFRGTGASM